MGASGSVNGNNGNNENIYISYSDDDVNAGLLHDELINSGHNIINLSLEFAKDNNLSINTISHTITSLMTKSIYIIICISEKTASSFRQAVEIDNALNSNKNIIYVMTDSYFTPLNKPYLNAVVKHNKWLPAYDKDTLTSTLEEFDVLLHN